MKTTGQAKILMSTLQGKDLWEKQTDEDEK